MYKYFPKVVTQSPSNAILAQDFDLLKRDAIHDHFVGYDQVRDEF
jgi:hypothetical protein